MKRLILTIIMLVSLSSYAGQDGGGGGVIKRDGMFLTFGSAGLKVKLSAPQGLEQVPGLELMLSVLDAQTMLPVEFSGQLINALLPSNIRRYFKIDQSELNYQTYKRLIAEYSKLWSGQIDPKNLDLAAITVAQDTYLLPPFFKLKQTEQAAILFHESIWVIKPSVSYAELVNAEITMQNHIERYGTQAVYNADLMAAIAGIFDNIALVVAMAIKEDIQQDYITRIVEKEEVVQISKRKTEKIIIQKKEFINFYNLIAEFNEERWYGFNHETGEFLLPASQIGKFVVEVRKAQELYPKSLSLKLLYSLRNNIYHAKFYSASHISVRPDGRSWLLEQVSVAETTLFDIDIYESRISSSCMKAPLFLSVCFYNNRGQE